jgi:hypothetical protein
LLYERIALDFLNAIAPAKPAHAPESNQKRRFFRMQPTEPVDARELELARIAGSESDLATLRKHVSDIVKGPAFKGSLRSVRFLRYILDQAIQGHFDALKERVIGVELFRRAPTYDTSEDAIVRVTASDVRKRLLQHYERNGTDCGFRISLPVGSYLPEISRVPIDALPAPSSAAHLPAPIDESQSQQPKRSEAVISVDGVERLRSPTHPRWGWFPVLAIALGLAIAIVFWRPLVSHTNSPQKVLPWSVLLSAQHPLQLITSDPNIAEIQAFTGGQLSASDYANHNYLAGPNKLSPEAERFCRNVLRGNKSATIDTQIAVEVAALAREASQTISVRGARDVQFADLRNGNNFIFVGSPRSNPWVSIFADQLDFRFVFDPQAHSEYLVNARPRPNEPNKYVPTAIGGSTGDSFAIIALVENPDHSGHVLILAGADAEGTSAAGTLVTDLPHFSPLLQHCGIRSSGAGESFEMLLHVTTIAGSPSRTDLVACHLLPSIMPRH